MFILSDIVTIIKNSPFSEREKLEMMIDFYNDLQKTKWFGKKYINKDEMLKSYDSSQK